MNWLLWIMNCLIFIWPFCNFLGKKMKCFTLNTKFKLDLCIYKYIGGISNDLINIHFSVPFSCMLASMTPTDVGTAIPSMGPFVKSLETIPVQKWVIYQTGPLCIMTPSLSRCHISFPTPQRPERTLLLSTQQSAD